MMSMANSLEIPQGCRGDSMAIDRRNRSSSSSLSCPTEPTVPNKYSTLQAPLLMRPYAGAVFGGHSSPMGDDGYLAKWVGRNLAAARQARELSRRDAAALIGTTPEYLAQLERGQRNATFRAVERAGDALGVEAVLGLDNADLFRDPADFARVLGAVTAGHRQTTDEGR